MSAIETVELQKAIDGREVLRGLTLQVPEGHVYGLVGPSASGKTTIIASTEGNVTIPGREEKIGLNVYRKK